jgi:hypothetical protein
MKNSKIIIIKSDEIIFFMYAKNMDRQGFDRKYI